MLPTIDLLGRTIPTYGIFAGLGLVAAVIYLLLTEDKRDFPTRHTESALAVCVIGAFLGAKVVYLCTVLPAFLRAIASIASDPAGFFRAYLQSGFVFYGGLWGVLLAGYLYCRKAKLSFFSMCRTMLPMVPLFHAFGRVGCFCAGCCYGVPSPWGIAFSCSLFAPNGVTLLPVQLLEAAGEAILFGVLVWMARKPGSGKAMLQLWLAAYSVMRFVLEFFRGDLYRGTAAGLTTSQWFALLSVAALLLLQLHPGKRKQQAKYDLGER